MNDRLIHRGPDDCGVYCSGPVGLGQRRLAIIDVRPEAAAPLSNEDRTIWVTYNGEIYNHRSLRQDLEALGHQFRTGTDTEVLVHLYEEYGTECLSYLRGMFAFAIWDGPKQRLFAARDRMGQKPFFYSHGPNALIFASEIKALLDEPEVSRQPNFAALDAFLSLQYVPSPATAFVDVRKLAPGHFLVCGADGQLHVERYWYPRPQVKTGASREWLLEMIREKYREAVRLRMESDVPLGALLSGGIDSGATVAMMAQHSDRPVKTFTIGLEGFPSMNEIPYARKVAQRYGTDHHEMVVKPDAAAVLPGLLAQYDEPFADSSALPTYYVSKLAREHVKVALAGDGGDESFAGYRRYGRMARWSSLDFLSLPVRRGLLGPLERGARALPASGRTLRLRKGLHMLTSPLPERYRYYCSIFKPEDKQLAYTEDFLQMSPMGGESFAPPVDYAANDSVLDWLMRHDQSNYLAQCLNTKVDIASMANSLEVRAPFEDHKFVEFAATIPASLKWEGGRSKALLRDAMGPLLPAEVIDKPKSGFTIPIADWFRNELAGLLRDTLLDERARRRGVIRPSYAKRLVEEHMSGQRDWSVKLWALVSLEIWFRSRVD